MFLYIFIDNVKSLTIGTCSGGAITVVGSCMDTLHAICLHTCGYSRQLQQERRLVQQQVKFEPYSMQWLIAINALLYVNHCTHMTLEITIVEVEF